MTRWSTCVNAIGQAPLVKSRVSSNECTWETKGGCIKLVSDTLQWIKLNAREDTVLEDDKSNSQYKVNRSLKQICLYSVKCLNKQFDHTLYFNLAHFTLCQLLNSNVSYCLSLTTSWLGRIPDEPKNVEGKIWLANNYPLPSIY